MQRTCCCDALWLPSTLTREKLELNYCFENAAVWNVHILHTRPWPLWTERKVCRAESGKDPVLKNKTCRFRTGQHKLRIDIPFSPQPCRYLKGKPLQWRINARIGAWKKFSVCVWEVVLLNNTIILETLRTTSSVRANFDFVDWEVFSIPGTRI